MTTARAFGRFAFSLSLVLPHGGLAPQANPSINGRSSVPNMHFFALGWTQLISCQISGAAVSAFLSYAENGHFCARMRDRCALSARGWLRLASRHAILMENLPKLPMATNAIARSLRRSQFSFRTRR